MIAAAPRATRPAAGVSASDGDDASAVVTVAIVAASAGAVCGGLLGAGWRRRKSDTA
jgi:hypothetical protein